MGHIQNWPKATAFVFGDPPFPDLEEEVEFWKHLLECRECRLGLYDIPGTRDFEIDGFWKEVAKFVGDIHPSAEHIAQSVIQVRAAARMAREGKYTDRLREYLVTWDGSVLKFHLEVCSRCYFGVYEEVWKRVMKLPNFTELVKESHQRLLSKL